MTTVDLDKPHFGGATFDEGLDGRRLARQLGSVQWLMADGAWRTLRRIATALDYPEASVSARLRDIRKQGYLVERRRFKPGSGLWEYRVVLEGQAGAPR
jgi:hypothetical protein